MPSPLLVLSPLDIALPSPSWPWFGRTGKERDLSIEKVIPPGQTYNSPAPAPRRLQRPRGGAQSVPPAAGWAGACAQAPAGLPAGLSRGGAPALWAFSAGRSLAGAGRGGAGLRGEVLAGPCLGAEARLLLLLQRSGGGGGESERARLRRGRWPGQREPQSGSSSGVGGRGRQRRAGRAGQRSGRLRHGECKGAGGRRAGALSSRGSPRRATRARSAGLAGAGRWRAGDGSDPSAVAAPPSSRFPFWGASFLVPVFLPLGAETRLVCEVSCRGRPPWRRGSPEQPRGAGCCSESG